MNQFYIYKQSGVVPFKYENKQLKILIIKSLRNKNWIFPKGIVEPEMGTKKSAKNEAFEEAGIKGKFIGTKLGKYKVEKWNGVCKVKLFPFQVTEILNDWPEKNIRQRKWIKINEANKYIENKKILKLIAKLEQMLTSNNVR